MRFPFREFEEKATVSSYILENLNISTWDTEQMQILKDYALRIKEKLGAPESAYLLRCIYYNTYLPPLPETENEIFKTVMYRPEENPMAYTNYYMLLQDYKAYEIRQCFNLSFKEYLEVTPREKKYMDAFAKDWAEQMAKAMRQQQDSQPEDLQHRLKESNYSSGIPAGPAVGAMMDFNDALMGNT